MDKGTSNNDLIKNLFVLFLLISIVFPTSLFADTIESIKSKISDNTSSISALTKEIAAYENELANIAKQKDSLANTLKTLELTKKKLETDIKITEQKIGQKNLEISGLSDQISTASDTIDFDRKIVSKSFSAIGEVDNQSIIETLLSNSSISTALDSMDQVAELQMKLREKIYELNNTKLTLETNKKTKEKAKSDLVVLSKQLSDQKKVVLNTTNEKNALLKETKDSESSYQKLLANRQAQKVALEQEISSLEAALKIAVDPNSIPEPGRGILRYPLDTIRITQYFGNTDFSATHSSIYNGAGHNGVDFAAAIGTPVKSAEAGIVLGFGNTDTACPAASLGKWILIKHNNTGLTTLYAHLSVISVSQGQMVSRGEIVGSSGYTGAVSPPGPRGAHLHFGVYVSDGVAISKYSFKSCSGSSITMPVLIKSGAYLNPLSYL